MAALTMGRNSTTQAFTRRVHSSADKQRITGESTPGKGLTIRQAASFGTLPLRQARLRAAFRTASRLLAVTRLFRTLSAPTGSARRDCRPTRDLSRAGTLDKSACQ